MEKKLHRPQLADQRPSSPNASGLMIDGRSSTQSGSSRCSEAGVRIALTPELRQAAKRHLRARVPPRLIFAVGWVSIPPSLRI